MTQSATTSMHHVTFGSGLKAEAKWRWKIPPKEKFFMKNLSQRMLFPLKVNKYSVCHTKSHKLSNELSLETACEASYLLFYWEAFSCQVHQHLVSQVTGLAVNMSQRPPFWFPRHIKQNPTSSSSNNYYRGTGSWTLEVNSDDFRQICPMGKQTSSFCFRLQVISPCKPLWL